MGAFSLGLVKDFWFSFFCSSDLCPNFLIRWEKCVLTLIYQVSHANSFHNLVYSQGPIFLILRENAQKQLAKKYEKIKSWKFKLNSVRKCTRGNNMLLFLLTKAE